MAGTLADREQNLKIIQRIAELEETVQQMRSNQLLKATFGNIVIDGTGVGTITIGNIVITASGNGSITIGNLVIDGTGVITVSDGTNKRVLVGFQSGGF